MNNQTYGIASYVRTLTENAFFSHVTESNNIVSKIGGITETNTY